MSEDLLQCFNRGCGQKFNPKENKEDSCRHHPGEPFFHDAYKGWSCCNKKCTDFTEFLNIKGCTLSSHSNIKPPEPEKPTSQQIVEDVIEIKPIVPNSLPRPPFDSPLVPMKPEIAASLKQLVEKEKIAIQKPDSGEISVGTSCRNGGCKAIYEGPETNATPCVHHPGCPVFHEGLKFWTCCKKRTTDFQAFLDQVGCETGNHVWKKEGSEKNKVCRWDYHQTALHVIVTIYAKQYDVHQSVIKLNPIRLFTNLVFPQEDATFILDMELKGIIDVGQSKLTMYSTKVELSLKKAEPGSWPRLDIPRKIETKKNEEKTADITSRVDAVDLSDL